MTTKRFWVALAVMAVILAMCSVSTWDLRQGLDALENHITAMQATPHDDKQALEAQAQGLMELWDRRESRFVLYVNHETLNHITQLVAELPALVNFEDHSLVYSHLDAIAALLDDLWQSSLPSYKTLL